MSNTKRGLSTPKCKLKTKKTGTVGRCPADEGVEEGKNFGLTRHSQSQSQMILKKQMEIRFFLDPKPIFYPVEQGSFLQEIMLSYTVAEMNSRKRTHSIRGNRSMIENLKLNLNDLTKI